MEATSTVAVLDQLLLSEGQVRVAAGLVQGLTGHGARLAASRGAHERSGRSPLLQLELAVSAEDSLVLLFQIRVFSVFLGGEGLCRDKIMLVGGRDIFLGNTFSVCCSSDVFSRRRGYLLTLTLARLMLKLALPRSSPRRCSSCSGWLQWRGGCGWGWTSATASPSAPRRSTRATVTGIHCRRAETSPPRETVRRLGISPVGLESGFAVRRYVVRP